MHPDSSWYGLGVVLTGFLWMAATRRLVSWLFGRWLDHAYRKQLDHPWGVHALIMLSLLCFYLTGFVLGAYVMDVLATFD